MKLQPVRPLEYVTIYKDSAVGSWMADSHRDPSAAQTRFLFGTTAIPSAFTLRASETTVRRGFGRCNPGVVITRGTDR